MTDEVPPLSPDLARRLAHEVRSPLGVITGVCAELEARVDEDGARLVDLARRSSRRLQRLVDRCDWIARAIVGDLGAPPQAMPLRPTVEAGVRAGELYAGRRRIGTELQTGQAGRDERLIDRPDVLRQAVEELVHNALRHARAHVTVNLSRAPDGVCIAVLDDGPGFDVPPGEAFAPRAGTGSGLGLGLWLARRLMRLRGGDVRIDRTSPEGSTVVVVHHDL
jgi:signal transduction histidine kinase